MCTSWASQPVSSLPHCWWCWPDREAENTNSWQNSKDGFQSSWWYCVNINGVNTAVSAGKKNETTVRSMQKLGGKVISAVLPLITGLLLNFRPLLMCSFWLTFWEISAKMKAQAQTDAWWWQTGVKIFFLFSLFLATELFYQHKHDFIAGKTRLECFIGMLLVSVSCSEIWWMVSKQKASLRNE